MNTSNIIQTLKDWMVNISNDMPVGDLYLFGSSIINNGLLFDPKTSDIDLVVTFPDEIRTATDRTRWLGKLKPHKINLELEFIKLFKRTHNNKTIVSLIPVSKQELRADIHKSGVRDFFKDNQFYNIITDTNYAGIAGPELIDIDDSVRNINEFCQKIRNTFLAVSFITSEEPLTWDSETDVVPKELIRTCSVAAYVENGKKLLAEKTDLMIGRSHLEHYVYKRRHEDELYLNMYNFIGKRALRKGEPLVLAPEEYLFISEMIFDMTLTLVESEKIEESVIEAFSSSQPVDISNAISVEFVIGENGLLKGAEDELHQKIINATVNLAWQTEPYFTLTIEEIDQLKFAIDKNPANGPAVDRIRKLKLINEDLIEGFKYIIYYQNYFFKTENKVGHVLTCLRSYCITRYANIFLQNNLGGAQEGFLEAYIFDYGNLSIRYPGIKIKSVIKFGLPDSELDEYLATNEALQSQFPDEEVSFMTLSAYNQPILTIKPELLAYFFVPLIIDRLVRAKIDPCSQVPQIVAFNNEYTNLAYWSFGIQ